MAMAPLPPDRHFFLLSVFSATLTLMESERGLTRLTRSVFWQVLLPPHTHPSPPAGSLCALPLGAHAPLLPSHPSSLRLPAQRFAEVNVLFLPASYLQRALERVCELESSAELSAFALEQMAAHAVEAPERVVK